MDFINILIGGGLLAFIQWAVDKYSLWRNKKDKTAEAIEGLTDKVSELKDTMDERDAVLARTHILRFNDELLNNVEHSNEYFMQTIDDIKTYENYCEKHPQFSNGRTIQAANNIRRTYERLFDSHKLN